uniref:hypothetical protein n=1 Tax=Arthrobacter silvisoli TaxID=2291022 RepID=UPI003F491F9C
MSTSIGFEEDMGQGSRNYGREAMLKRIGELARQRRDELGLSRDAFRREIGLGSDKTIQDFEFGRLEPRSKTLMLIEKGLRWRVGSVQELIDDPDRRVGGVIMEDLDEHDSRQVTTLASFSTLDLLDELRKRFLSIQAGMGGPSAGAIGPKDLYGLAASGGHKPEHLDDNPDDGIDGLNISPN